LAKIITGDFFTDDAHRGHPNPHSPIPNPQSSIPTSPVTVSNIQPTDAGRYSVVVDTASGMFTNHVYLLVDTQFERIEMGDTTSSVACAWGDYNNDDYLDLFVSDGNPTSTPLAALWRNLGNGRFVEATEAGSFASGWLWGNPIWGDFNRDGHLDLFVANAWCEPPQWDVSNALYLSQVDGGRA
jgi:hypothetical protein